MASPSWKRFVKPTVKAVIAVAVLAAVARHVFKTWSDLQTHSAEIRFDPIWIGVAVLLYMAGLGLCGLYYGRILQSSSTPIPLSAAIRAYLISHLGKYVPGKAMVVVMRAGLSTPYGARAATAAIATFYETLVMMAAGALLSAVGFALGPEPVQYLPIVLSISLTLAFLVVVEPRLFPRIARIVSTPFKALARDAEPTFSNGLLAFGLLITLLGWTLMGLSQVAVVRALTRDPVPLTAWPVVVASVALATVAGFVVAVLPGGLGVREWVLINVLKPALGEDVAVVAALALRLTWVLAEVASAAVLTLLRPVPTAPPRSDDRSEPSPLPVLLPATDVQEP